MLSVALKVFYIMKPALERVFVLIFYMRTSFILVASAPGPDVRDIKSGREKRKNNMSASTFWCCDHPRNHIWRICLVDESVTLAIWLGRVFKVHYLLGVFWGDLYSADRWISLTSSFDKLFPDRREEVAPFPFASRPSRKLFNSARKKLKVKQRR